MHDRVLIAVAHGSCRYKRSRRLFVATTVVVGEKLHCRIHVRAQVLVGVQDLHLHLNGRFLAVRFRRHLGDDAVPLEIRKRVDGRWTLDGEPRRALDGLHHSLVLARNR